MNWRKRGHETGKTKTRPKQSSPRPTTTATPLPRHLAATTKKLLLLQQLRWLRRLFWLAAIYSVERPALMPQRRKGRRLTRRKAKGPPALVPRDSDSRNRPSTSPSPTERRRWPHGRRRGAAPDAADREPSDGRNGHLVGEATRRRDHRHRGAAVRRRQCGSAPAPCRWQYCARAQALREIDAPRDRDGGRHCTASSSAPAHAVILDRRPPRGAAVRRQRFDRQLVGTGARGREVVLDRRPPRGAAVRHRRVDRQFIGTGARGRPRQAR